MIREFASKSAELFRSDKPEDGLVWFTAFLEQYTDTRTPIILDHVKKKDYGAAAELLEALVKTL